MKEQKITIRVKKTPTTAAGTPILEWFENNTGNFPGKVELKKLPAGAAAIVDGNPIGMIQGNDGKPYPCTEFNFDDSGKCTDEYEFVLTGLVEGVKNTMSATIIRHIIEVQQVAATGTEKFQDEIDRIVSNGIRTQAEMDIIMASMQQNQLTDAEIFAVLAENKAKCPLVKPPKAIYHKVNAEEDHARSMVQYALGGRSFILEGGQSVGKNVAIETVCFWLNIPWFLLTMGADMTQDDIYGGKSTDNSASNQLTLELATKAMNGDAKAQAEYDLLKAKAASVRIVIDPSEFYDWLTVKDADGKPCRAAFICNEFNLMDTNLSASIFNPVLDGTAFISMPGRGRVAVNPQSFVVGTQNPGFEGTQDQNQATKSRFAVLKFGYAENIIAPLKAGLKDFADKVPQVVYNQVNKLYMETLGAVKSGEISDACLNIRGYVEAIRMATTWNDSIAKHIMLNVVNGCPAADQEVLRQKVINHFDN